MQLARRAAASAAARRLPPCNGRRVAQMRAMAMAEAMTQGAYLVDAGWLAQTLRLRSDGAEMARGAQLPARDRIAVLHAAWADGRPAANYLDGHIPGALFFDTDWLENGYPRWSLRDPAVLQQCFGACGVAADATIVVYADAYDAACRLWWVLRYCGAQDVRVLAGGRAGWRAAGLPLDTTPVAAGTARFDAPLRTEYLASTSDVRAALVRADAQLIDVRTPAEYLGQRSGYAYLDCAGRIPGAINADSANLSALLDARDCAGIAAYWAACGVTTPASAAPGNTLPRGAGQAAATPIFYCGSGWRSSVAMLCAACLGAAARNYCAGWCGWSTRYVPDSEAGGSTPGWRQEATGNPIVVDPATPHRLRR